MDIETRATVLAERYRRLRIASEAVLDEARPAGDAEHPLVGLPPHVLRRLRRELAGEPQPSAMTWMSVE